LSSDPLIHLQVGEMSSYRVDADGPLPRYYQVYVSLEERIRSGEFAPGEALPSERQLVLDYGVSRITVVKALDLLVRDNLVERQHGRGNFVMAHAEPLACMENCRIAFCVPTPSESYIFSTLMGATRVAMRNRIQLQIVAVEADEEEVKAVRDVVASGVAGMIIFSRSTRTNAAFYAELQEKNFPFVMIDRYCPDVHTDRVLFDDTMAGYQLTEFLITQGHRRIAALPGSEEVSSVEDRLRGYRKALEDHGIAYDTGLVCQSVYEALGISRESIQSSRGATEKLIERVRESAPTAIFTINNYIAEQAHIDLMQIHMELLQALVDTNTQGVNPELNIAIVSVTHKNNLPKSAPCVALALQPGELLGEKGMELLIGRISDTLPIRPHTILLPMEIVPLVRRG
jgi:GntR family transcriptional regulator of arabinose operon